MTGAEAAEFARRAPDPAIRRVHAAAADALMGWIGASVGALTAAARAAVEVEIIATPEWSRMIGR